MPKKDKKPYNPFKTRSRARSVDGPDQTREEELLPCEFRETAVTFSPAIPRTEVALTLQFRCTAKLVRGDTVTFKLGGFKGPHPGVFTLESRPHPDKKDFHDSFHAYWAGESAIKGGPAAQTITLLCRKTIDVNTLVIVGVPETTHIVLPDKLAKDSPKLKIDGNVRHSQGGAKIAKAPVESCTEIKKKPIDDDVNELTGALKDFNETACLSEEEAHFALDMTAQEVDRIWETAKDLSDLKIGLTFKLETSVFKTFDEYIPLCDTIMNNYIAAGKTGTSLALHREIAKNFGVKVGTVIMLEDALYSVHGCHYPELSRAAVMVLRLYTCESFELMRLFGLVQAPCIYREINSAVRMQDPELLGKWTQFIGVMQTCPARLTHIPELVPLLYKGVKDLPPEALQYLANLKPESWYVFPNFTTAVPDVKFQDESFTAPDNAVLFEIQGASDGIELSDVSQYPEDGEWLLPMFSSFTIISVETLAEKNNMLLVTMRMNSCLTSARDGFADQQRNLAPSFMRRARTDCLQMAEKSLWLSKMVHCNIKLNTAKYLHPQYVVHQQYLEKFADVKRLSQARQVVDDGSVKWQQCTNEALQGADGVTRPAQWDVIPKKQAAQIESLWLKSTRLLKQFPNDGLTVDFNEWTVDFGKGGPKRLRRLIGKMTSHGPTQ